MYGRFGEVLRGELDAIREQGLYKEERVLEGPQGAEIQVGGRKVLNARRAKGRKVLSA